MSHKIEMSNQKQNLCGGDKFKSCFCHIPRNKVQIKFLEVDVVAILFQLTLNNNKKTVCRYGVQSNKLSTCEQ